MAVKGIEELKPVYLIFGSEDLLLDRAVRRLRERVAEVADLDFNYEAFDGETAHPDAIVAAANTLPFASERRLVIVKGVDRMKAPQQAVLAEYATDPSPTTCLVLVAAKMRRDSRLFKAVDALGGAAEYKAPGRKEYPSWVITLFASHGRTIGRDAAETFVALVGRDLRRLEGEADKVIAYAGERTKLTREDIENVVSETAPVSIFDFLNAIGARQCGRALELLADLLGDGEDLTGIHAMTMRHLRSLISARALEDRGMSTGAMQRELGMADWQVRNTLEQARRFESVELTRALRQAAEVEARMKSGRGDQRVVFETWLVSVCRSAD